MTIDDIQWALRRQHIKRCFKKVINNQRRTIKMTKFITLHEIQDIGGRKPKVTPIILRADTIESIKMEDDETIVETSSGEYIVEETTEQIKTKLESI